MKFDYHKLDQIAEKIINYCAIILICIFIAIYFEWFTIKSVEISRKSFFNDYLKNSKVSRVEIVNHKWVNVILKDNSVKPWFYISNSDTFEDKLEKKQIELQINEEDSVPVLHKEKSEYFKNIWKVFAYFVVVVIILKIISVPLDKIAEQKSKVIIVEKKSSIKFNDIAGYDKAKTEIMELVEFMKDSKKYSELGAQVPRGALFVGPPGTGKTLLAKAAAGEAGVSFIACAGTEFVEIYVGQGAARIRKLFSKAKKQAPCIIFIDEIDAIGGKRDTWRGGSCEVENTLNQLLIEMDGFSTQSNIIVMAATNRISILDPALLRSGRFDRKIHFTLPDCQERALIYQVHLNKSKTELDKKELSYELANLTDGFSGADIAVSCNEAALLAVRESSSSIKMSNYEAAIEKIKEGMKQNESA